MRRQSTTRTRSQNFQVRIGPGDTPAFQCGSDETLLAAALRAGLGFPYECQSGSCSSCRFQLLEGEVRDVWSTAPGLTPEERDQGIRLGCQSTPGSDCRIKLRLKLDYVPPVMPTRQQAQLVDVVPLTEDMSEFRFRTEAPAEFLPGQFALLRLPGVVGTRAYSMSNLSNGGGEWHFIVKRKHGGRGTSVLFDVLQRSDDIELEGPYGRAYLRTDTGRDIVCIGGGSGLSPMLSILRGAVGNPAMAERRLLMFYGGRTPQDHCVPDIFAGDSEIKRRVALWSAISDVNAETAKWEGERGFIHEVLEKQLGPNPGQYDYYFCGPPPMTDAVHKLLLLNWGVPSAQLHFDRFI